MKDKVFIDSNIIIYAYTNDEPDKKSIALNILNNRTYVLSVQVIREVTNTLIHKFKIAESTVMEQAQNIINFSEVLNESTDLIIDAIAVKTKYNYGFYDCLIIAAALKSKANILYTEDMQHNQVINKTLKIVNPFI